MGQIHMTIRGEGVEDF